MEKSDKELAKEKLEALKKTIIVDQDGTATWSLDILGVDGNLYAGLFRFKTIMDPLETLAADRDQRRLLGEHQAFASDIASNIAFMLSQLKQRVIECPPFWRTGSEEFPGGRIKEYSVITTVFDAAVAAMEVYQDSLRAQATLRANRIRQVLKDRSKVAKEADEAQDAKDSADEQ